VRNRSTTIVRGTRIVVGVRTISVLVVDDHVAFADAVRELLETDAGLRPVRVAYSLEQATAQVASLHPNVAIVDLRLTDGTGIDFARQAKSLSPRTRVVIVSALESPDAVLSALFQGVRVWLPKSAEPRRLIRAVRVAHRGRAWLPPDVLTPVLDALVERAAGSAAPLDRLSNRELQILGGLAAGKSRAALATELHLSLNTIRSHVQHITSKLGVHTTLQAVAIYNRYDQD
jgi:two-component system, NarL family, nitrate/nitrite response regulator NarL